MSYHLCHFCNKESRFVCVKCKKDICKDHAFYERFEESGEWVCSDCHEQNTTLRIIWYVIAGIIVVIFLILAIVFIFPRF